MIFSSLKFKLFNYIDKMKNNDIKLGSNRSFGLVFFVVFLIISLYPFIVNSENIRIWAAIISVIFLILGLLNSKILTPLNKLWFKFGLFLGKLISPIVMGAIFFFVVTPIGFLMRAFGKDLLRLKFNQDETYWIEKDETKSSMKNQF